MTKEIHKFIEDVADYINRFVVGREGSHIIECVPEGRSGNRGHTIPVKCAPVEDNGTSFGPCFYAEELLERYNGYSAAAIAEIMAGETESVYEDMAETVKIQKEVCKKDIRQIDPEDLFLTADRILNSDRAEDPLFLSKRSEDLGLLLMIKVKVDHPGRKKPDTAHAYP